MVRKIRGLWKLVFPSSVASAMRRYPCKRLYSSSSIQQQQKNTTPPHEQICKISATLLGNVNRHLHLENFSSSNVF